MCTETLMLCFYRHDAFIDAANLDMTKSKMSEHLKTRSLKITLFCLQNCFEVVQPHWRATAGFLENKTADSHKNGKNGFAFLSSLIFSRTLFSKDERRKVNMYFMLFSQA